MKNFQVEDKESGKKYWISRAMAVCGIVIVNDGEQRYVLVNKRGEGAPNYKGCWNLICGYLDWDETLKEAVSREVLEETKVAIPPRLWEMVYLADNPNKDEYQNVTIRYEVVITMEQFNRFSEIGKKKQEANGGEENEVADIWLMPLNKESIDSVEWAFNHKNILENEMLRFNYGL